MKAKRLSTFLFAQQEFAIRSSGCNAQAFTYDAVLPTLVPISFLAPHIPSGSCSFGIMWLSQPTLTEITSQVLMTYSIILRRRRNQDNW